ncbi:Putative SOS response-associated peptidase YedK [Stieleria neptunia]|uniref:Abasic site processing protein n=1 Tax=Stieleria neptunia TaxID=2527979 RepID=A0A518I2Q0_9BACT|nr:SOS response-associated peptidase [Stieleria neptunia]QDV47385.1 Putative SOS response-associated peptidase YedK [Stieleria neptunia]
MCGRINLRTPAAAWTQEFLPLWSDEEIAAKAAEYESTARYNIAPTQNVSCIRAAEDPRREWVMLRWGLVPSWADDLAIGNRMINARSETVHEKPSFKKAFAQRRCLIPADGYYEWMKTADGKQPYLIEPSDGSVLALAGLWERNRKIHGDDRPIETFTILTTSANDTTRSIHDRMPVILDADGQAAWLETGLDDPSSLRELLRPAPNDLLTAFPVSRTVNSPRNDVPECVERIELSEGASQQQDLF